MFLHKIQNHGELTPFPGSNADDDLFLHSDAAAGGGIILRDEAGVIPSAIKEITRKVAT
jgi:hypothetical protein